MSVFETTHQVPLGSITTFRVVSFFERAFETIKARQNARSTEAALRDLSDQQLADVGLHRGDIAAVAEALARG